ncbi:MAG: diguanylate cyclase [Chloroflexi bacterium]|nr:diguanylate cyclase [Chloroflexota bacterium]
MDGFKALNDSLGHAAGDECLELIGETVSTVTAGKAERFRYGGDEAVVVFPNATLAEAHATAERIRPQSKRRELTTELPRASASPARQQATSMHCS